MNTQATAATGTVCDARLFKFPAVKWRQFAAYFSGADTTSNGGLPLLHQTGRAAAWALHEVLLDQSIASFHTPTFELILEIITMKSQFSLPTLVEPADDDST